MLTWHVDYSPNIGIYLHIIYINLTGNRRGSLGVNNMLGTEVIIIRERRLVHTYMVKSGMLRFNFLLDCCQPGSVPDPHLIAALLDLVNSLKFKNIIQGKVVNKN